MSHLLRVAGTVLEFGGSEDEAIAALLHDAIEDQGGTKAREDILGRFGGRVVEIIDGCTDTDQQPKPPWRARKEAFLERLRGAPSSVCLVVGADKLDNVRSLAISYRQQGDSVWTGFHGGRDGTLWYHRRVVEILAHHGLRPLVDELRRAFDELVRLIGE